MSDAENDVEGVFSKSRSIVRPPNHWPDCAVALIHPEGLRRRQIAYRAIVTPATGHELDRVNSR